MTEELVVVGIGGFGREILDVVDAVNSAAERPLWRILGVIDDAPSDVNLERLKRLEVPFLGGSVNPPSLPEGCHFLIGVSNARIRRMLADRLNSAGLRAATVVHPAATLGADCSVGEGSVVCAGVRVTTNVRLGRHVHLNINCTVGHDSVLGDFVSLNPLSSVSGDCKVEDDALIGVAGVVLQGLNIGKGSTVGGSACVVRDVPPGVVVKGIPAR